MAQTTLSKPAVPLGVQGVQVVCGAVAVLAVLPALMYTSSALLAFGGSAANGGDPYFRSDPPWVDYANATLAVVLWCVAGCLGWAALRLGSAGHRRIRAWRAGLFGAGLTSPLGAAVVLAPLTDPKRAAVGGFGQPWMPEMLIGGMILVVGGLLVWLLLTPITRRWVSGTPSSPVS